MYDTLISFETAKLAKEKGFDVCCHNGWDIVKPFTSYTHTNFRYAKDGIINTNNKIAQPTQSLLQKWLREEHDIHITTYCFAQGGWGFDIAGAGLNKKLVNWANLTPHKTGFKSYEEALEQGLIEALKLI